MKALRALFLLLTSPLTAAQDVFCPGPPSAGCTNGMFSEKICGCVCIHPFCPDAMGDCTIPGGGCTDQQISTSCTRGVDCPWWVNSLKAESCQTGNVVPAGLWNVYSSNEDCCTVNFPFSEVCNVEVGTPAPTKYPTIALTQSPFETVPIMFSVQGLPDDVNMAELKKEMKLVITSILTMVAKDVPEMKVSGIDERVERRRRLGGSSNDINKISEKSSSRNLLRNVEFYYDVNLFRVDGKQFGPLIIQTMKDSMSDIQNQIETTKSQYFQSDVNVNFCTLSSGKYNLCTSTPEPVKRPQQVTAQANLEEETGGGLPGWAVALIVIFVLALVGCMGYLMYVSSRDGEIYDKKMEDMYAEEMKSSYSRRSRGGKSSSGRSYRSRSSRSSRRSGRSRSSRSRTSRSRRSGSRSRYSRRTKDSKAENSGLILAFAEEPAFGDEFTVDTYKTAKKRKPDPSIYNPNAIDPDGGITDDSGVLMLTNGEDPSSMNHRRYMEDPPLKPKREPTMYVDGHIGDDTSLYSAKYGQGSIGSAAKYASDPLGMDGLDEDDPFGDYHQKGQSMYMGSESNAEFQRGAKDPSFYAPAHHADESSFRTQEPSVGGRKERSKKNMKRSEVRRNVEESLASSWGDVLDGMGEMKQKSKSFY